MQGWISLHRKSLESVVFHNPNLWQVWCYCLLRANHKENKIFFEGKEIFIKPGQFITGRFQGSKDCKMKPSTFRNQLEKLKKMKNLDIQSDNKNSIITIVNWAQYQDAEKKADSEKENKKTTSEQQVDTDNNDSNVSNGINAREHEHALLKKPSLNPKNKKNNWRHRKRNKNEKVLITKDMIQKFFSREINQRDLDEMNNIAEEYGMETPIELLNNLTDKIYSTNIWDNEIIEATSKEMIYRAKIYEDEKNKIIKADLSKGKIDQKIIDAAKEVIEKKEKVIIKKIEPENKPVHLNLIPDFDAKAYADKHAVN